MAASVIQAIGTLANSADTKRWKWRGIGIVGFALACICSTSATGGLVATAAAAQATVTIDYSTPINSAASPYLFGGSNEPNPSDQATVYPMLNSVGVKFERGTIHLDQVLPAGITISDYLNNTNGVADPSNWNWGPLSWASEAKAQGFTTMANILYAPAWLTYSGTIKGVPSNWSVWQDIVTKIVEHEGSNLDYLEILNEPLNFLDISGSPYSTIGTAADDIYYYAAVAARTGNSTLIIGGDADSDNSGSFGALSNIIPDSRLTSNLLQFVSYHVYGPTAAASDNIGTLETLLANNGRSGLPIFITEWNYADARTTTDPHEVGGETITYVVMQFMVWSKQPQLAGLDIFSFIPNNEELSPYEDCTGTCDDFSAGFYSVNGSATTLVTQSRAYQLMSVAMGLGLGSFKVFPNVASSGVTGAQGFTTEGATHHAAMSMTNDSSTAKTVTVTLENIAASGCNFTVYIYTADTGSNTAVSPTSTLTNQCITNGTMMLSNIALPAYSAVGLTINYLY